MGELVYNLAILSTGIIARKSRSMASSTPSAETKKYTTDFLINFGMSAPIPKNIQFKDSYSHIFSNLIKAGNVQCGRISCEFSVVPALLNFFIGLHVGAVAERVAIVCARTVVAEDKDIFLGDLSISYLSAVPKDVVVMVDAYVIRKGRTLTVIAMEFKDKKTAKLAFTGRVILYNMPVAKL